MTQKEKPSLSHTRLISPGWSPQPQPLQSRLVLRPVHALAAQLWHFPTMQARALPVSRGGCAMRPVRRTQVTRASSSWVPDYTQPAVPGQRRAPMGLPSVDSDDDAPAARKWW